MGLIPASLMKNLLNTAIFYFPSASWSANAVTSTAGNSKTMKDCKNILGLLLACLASWFLILAGKTLDCAYNEVFDQTLQECINCQVCLDFPSTEICSNCTETAIGGGAEQKLYDDLFMGYNKRIRPLRNHSNSVIVSFTMSLNQIAEMDERNQILKTNVWTEQRWTDEIMQWDPTKYDGVEAIRLPADQVWLPDITLYNTADTKDYTTVNNLASSIILQSDGSLMLKSKPTVLKSTCRVFVQYFPFDLQVCKLKFGSWTFDSSQINLVNASTKPELKYFIKNEQWDLIDAITQRNVIEYVCCPERYVDVSFYICIQRKPLYYMINLIIPCILLSLLAILGFWMPYSVGVVKAGLSVTLFLSLTVFLLLVAETMPRTSDEVPLIGQYYLGTMFLVSLSTAMNVTVLNVNGSRREIPHWIQLFIVKFIGTAVCMQGVSQTALENATKLKEYQAITGCRSRTNGRYKSGQKILTTDFSLLSEQSLKSSASRNTISIHSLRDLTVDSTRPLYNEEDRLSTNDSGLCKLESHVDQIFKHLDLMNKKSERNKLMREQWSCVAFILDRALMFIFIIITLTMTLSMYLNTPMTDAMADCHMRIENGIDETGQ